MELELILKLLLAAMLGGVLGMERQIIQKESGLRATVLITTGSALLIHWGAKIAAPAAPENDSPLPLLLLAGFAIISIAVMGAATIIKERFSSQGLISATSAWTAGVAGVAVGMGLHLPALVAVLLIAALMAALNLVARTLENQRSHFPYLIITDERPSVLILIKKSLTELGLRHHQFHMRKVEKGFEVEFTVIASTNKNQAFLEKLMQTPGVREVINEHL